MSTPLIESPCEEICSIDDALQGWRLPHWRPATFIPIFDPVTQYYGAYVFNVQYFLANTPQIREIVMGSLQSHSACRKVVEILSELHSGRKRLPQRTDGIPLILRYLKHTGTGNLDDAMAVLHAVSAYLFNGGDGAWEECIDFAARHVDIVLSTTFFCDASPLQFCDEKTAFIVKTAIWFDVLASITSQKPPRLCPVIDRLFSPSRTHIEDLGDPLSNQCSMLSPMGCENDVVWALSEISALAEWKREQESQGRLSFPELVAKGKTLEQFLDNPRCLQPCRDDPTAILHYNTANIFRAAAHLYLAVVISGDHPLVREVACATQKTYSAITAIHRDAMQPVVRSTVFAFFLCGCFLVNRVQQDYIKDLLLYQEQSTEIGNCRSIVDLLETIWRMKSSPEDPRPVPWQTLLREKHILLV
ncbi:hypothetical protein AX14_008718 [Amanita brunnescens Koide BX004]|jgi:hypothetical protein|nr:hypothetical protein AX14_008718 [Amanita brunnescens Koide BX004]